MVQSDYKKVFKQLKVKPAKLKKYIKHNAPAERTTGIRKTSCRRCGRHRGNISQYGLNICRQCFREIAPDIGFKKFS